MNYEANTDEKRDDFEKAQFLKTTNEHCFSLIKIVLFLFNSVQIQSIFHVYKFVSLTIHQQHKTHQCHVVSNEEIRRDICNFPCFRPLRRCCSCQNKTKHCCLIVYHLSICQHKYHKFQFDKHLHQSLFFKNKNSNWKQKHF